MLEAEGTPDALRIFEQKNENQHCWDIQNRGRSAQNEVNHLEECSHSEDFAFYSNSNGKLLKSFNQGNNVI